MKNKKDNLILTIILFVGLSISILFILLLVFGVFDRDKGEYNYCVEWEGFGGKLRRSNLLYTCFNLASQTFYCDYEINKVSQILMVKPIINVTKGNDGFITEINYDEANYFNCTRWLKSKEVKNEEIL